MVRIPDARLEGNIPASKMKKLRRLVDRWRRALLSAKRKAYTNLQEFMTIHGFDSDINNLPPHDRKVVTVL